MNSFTFICVAALLVAFAEVSNGAAEGKNCKAILSDLTKRQMAGMAACTKSMTFKNGKDKAAKMNCVLKCVMMNEGILGPDGKLNVVDLDGFLGKEFPDSMIPTVKPLFENCMKEAANVDPTEEFCKSYDPFIKCLMGAIGNLCPK